LRHELGAAAAVAMHDRHAAGEALDDRVAEALPEPRRDGHRALLVETGDLAIGVARHRDGDALRQLAVLDQLLDAPRLDQRIGVQPAVDGPAARAEQRKRLKEEAEVFARLVGRDAADDQIALAAVRAEFRPYPGALRL